MHGLRARGQYMRVACVAISRVTIARVAHNKLHETCVTKLIVLCKIDSKYSVCTTFLKIIIKHHNLQNVIITLHPPSRLYAYTSKAQFTT